MSDDGARILEVDLFDRTTGELRIDAATRRKYLGGSGLGAHLFFERRKWQVDALGPDNDLFVLTGPLGGSALPGSSRLAVCARSPLTGIWGEGSGGGSFAPTLRRAGWDGIIITGVSGSPCTLVIDDDQVEVRDGADLWGLDVYQVNRKIDGQWPGKCRPSVLTIGQAGENRVKFASIANGNHSFSDRTGMGAVMGSKQLKAIICHSGSAEVALADPAGHAALRTEWQAKIAEGAVARPLEEMGLASAMRLGDPAGAGKAVEWCNRYGMDAISCGGVLALAYACFSEGLITEDDTGGIKLELGSPDGAIAMLHLIAKREGFGYILAEGSRRAAHRIGHKAVELSAEIKGRASPDLALAYLTSNRGACHKSDLTEAIEHGIVKLRGAGLEPSSDEGGVSEGQAHMVRLAQDLGVPLNALAICDLVVCRLQIDDLVKALQVCVGWDFTLAEYQAVGARLWLLERGLNNLMGVTRADRLPEKLRMPVPDGAAAGLVPDEELLLRQYYKERGLLPDGRPGREVLEQAGLEDLAQVLYD